MTMTRSTRLTLIGAAISCAIAALPLSALGSPAEAAPGESHALTLDPASGHLAGHIPAGASVAEVVRRIGELARIELEIRGDLGSLRDPVSVDGLSIEAALKRIAPNRSLVISYAPHRPGSESALSGAPGRTIQKIVVGGGPAVERRDPEPEAATAAKPLDPEVARAISARQIVALSYAADRAAIDKLRETAVASEEPATRRAALSALAGIAGRQNLELFIRSGLVDPDQSVRVEAARGIVRLMGDRGRTIVEAAASREDDPEARDIMRRLARGEVVERPARRVSAGFRR
jgi:hypothetical protein